MNGYFERIAQCREAYEAKVLDEASRRCTNCRRRMRWVNRELDETQFYCTIGNTTLDITDIQRDFGCNHFEPIIGCPSTNENH